MAVDRPVRLSKLEELKDAQPEYLQELWIQGPSCWSELADQPIQPPSPSSHTCCSPNRLLTMNLDRLEHGTLWIFPDIGGRLQNAALQELTKDQLCYKSGVSAV